MKFISIERDEFKYWCNQAGFPLPEFWFSLEYKPDHNHVERVYDVRESAKVSGSKGGKVRAEKYAPIKEKAIQIYESKHNHRSNRDAARRICEQMGSEMDDLNFSPTNRENTVAKWIGGHKQLKK